MSAGIWPETIRQNRQSGSDTSISLISVRSLTGRASAVATRRSLASTDATSLAASSGRETVRRGHHRRPSRAGRTTPEACGPAWAPDGPSPRCTPRTGAGWSGWPGSWSTTSRSPRTSPRRRSSRPTGGGRRCARPTRRWATCAPPPSTAPAAPCASAASASGTPRRSRRSPDLTRHVDSAETSAVTSDQRDEVLAVLTRCPTRQREVLVLRYYLDLSENDIATALGISRGAVKSHASRGISSLRARLRRPAARRRTCHERDPRSRWGRRADQPPADARAGRGRAWRPCWPRCCPARRRGSSRPTGWRTSGRPLPRPVATRIGGAGSRWRPGRPPCC